MVYAGNKLKEGKTLAEMRIQSGADIRLLGRYDGGTNL